MDPSPFHEKDLDDDLEEFIVSWATEYPLHNPIRLVVHLQSRLPGIDAQSVIERAVHNYFCLSKGVERARVQMDRSPRPRLWTLAHGTGFQSSAFGQ